MTDSGAELAPAKESRRHVDWVSACKPLRSWRVAGREPGIDSRQRLSQRSESCKAGCYPEFQSASRAFLCPARIRRWEGGDCIGDGDVERWRVAREPAQAFQKRGHARADPERGPAQAVVHFPERDAPDPAAASYSPCPASAAAARGAAEVQIATLAKGGTFGQRIQGQD